MRGTLILLSSVHWHFTWQRHQNLAAGLAGKGYAVLFVEPLPKRWPRPSEWRRVLGRLAGSSSSGTCEQAVPAGVRVLNPRVLPDQGKLARWLNQSFLVPPLGRAIQRGGLVGPVIVLNYLPTPSSLALQRSLPADLRIYDCAWDWSTDPYSRGLERVESELVRESDLVLADSPHNAWRMSQLHSRVMTLGHGVDYEAFAAAADEPPEADESSCAYFGDLGTSLDMELLRLVSQHHPLSLIGPVRRSLAGFSSRTRLHGPVRHDRLPGILRASRILLLPYRIAPDTRGIFPAKIMECLATGKPTVATRLPSLETLGDLIYLCAGADSFLSAIAAARSEEPARRAARQAMARRNTWEAQIARIDGWIQDCLAGRAPVQGP